MFFITIPLFPLIWLSWNVIHAINPVEYLLIHTGEISVYLLVGSLWMTPLQRVCGQRFPFLKRWNRYRRRLGVAVFGYALLHVSLYLVDQGEWDILVTDLQKIFILSGLGGFLILLLMALTSHNRAIKWLGAKRWKALHRCVYLAAILIALHILLKEKSPPYWAMSLFVPLGIAELFRCFQWCWLSKHQSITKKR